jgi:hypothetical protein
MTKDKHKTDVVFRVDTTKEWKGTIFALLPHEVSDSKGNVTSYQHIGQHSGADYPYSIRTSRPATQKEYKALKREMESLGYNLNIIKRRNYTKFLKSFKLMSGAIG